MVKNNTKYSPPQAVQSTRELLLWMIPQLDKLPKNRRYIMSQTGQHLRPGNHLNLMALLSLITAVDQH